jgi:phosphoribosylaminoimidazolecarboxamide formyltransferase/IMP cyclohydrolase
MRVLISVYDKTGLAAFARGLSDLGADIVASGGTAAFLEEHGIECTRVEELTEVPELLGGRVKTLHPRIHAGILARRDRDDDLAALAEHEIEPFDLVVVNLYPFHREPGVELIDIGGPAMLRAAAKNFEHVAAVSSAEDYDGVLSELRESGAVSPPTRARLAAKAFAHTSSYDAAITDWLEQEEPLRARLAPVLEKELELAYGENPHQAAAYYRVVGASQHLLSEVAQVHGRELSFINLYDLAAARTLLAELGDDPACVIVKHANPCGAAVAGTIEEAYERAYAGDPLSAFGMVVALNRGVTRALGGALADRFIDVLYAPSYDADGLEALRRKPATRILAGPELDLSTALDAKRVPGGVLVQEPDRRLERRTDMEVACGALDEAQWADLEFAWMVCKHVTSNAIVLAKDRQAIGIGAGQQSRVDAVRLAVEKARERGHDITGAALASDAFFPFPDGPQLALDAGVTAIVQPGGSKRDGEVAAAVDAAGAAMVLTHHRHFRQ